MQQGLAFLGGMAAVVATTVIVNAVSPADVGVQQDINAPYELPSPPGRPAVSVSPTPAPSSVPSVAPRPPDEVPSGGPVNPAPPTPATPATPRPTFVKPGPPPISVMPLPVTPPPSEEPCPVDLKFDPLLGICVVI